MNKGPVTFYCAFEYQDGNTPTLPEAKHGHFSPTFVAETAVQLEQHLVWSQCNFCGGYVLIKDLPENRHREKCACGARRISRYVWRHGEAINYEDGWRKNGVEWTMC